MSGVPAAADRGPVLHDVIFSTSAKRWYWQNRNRGITLDDGSLSWVHEGKPDGAGLRNIASVRLQRGGDLRNPSLMCAVTFADGFVLTATDGNESGLRDAAQAGPYRSFVGDLHGRLIAGGHDRVAFLAGLPPTNHTVVAVATILLFIIAVVLPFGMLLIFRAWDGLWVLIGGLALLWPMFRTLRSNAPGTYGPHAPPAEHLP